MTDVEMSERTRRTNYPESDEIYDGGWRHGRGTSSDKLSRSRNHGRRDSEDEQSSSPRSRREGTGDEFRRDRKDRERSEPHRHRKYRERSESRDRSHHRRRSRSPPAKRRRHSESNSPSPVRPREYHERSESHRDRKDRDTSESQERSRHHRRSRLPPAKKRGSSVSNPESPARGGRSRAPLPSQAESFHGTTDVAISDGKPPMEKQKPNYKPSGLLAKEANTISGTTTVLKYNEPPEGRKPPSKEQWRMYVFKKKDILDTVYLFQRSVWRAGRDEKVSDLFLEHPSVSKQHAVIQFRQVTTTSEFGDRKNKVKPYLLDLESANGTKLNGEKIEASRFKELLDGDVVTFGNSEREYVLMLPPSTA